MPATVTQLFPVSSETREVFRASFDKKAYLLPHTLHEHPLFTLPALKKLADKLAAYKQPKGYLKLANSSTNLDWGSPEFCRVMHEAFDDIESSRLRLKLSSIHSEPEYKEVLDECTREFSEIAGIDIAKEYETSVATLFIASPNEVTTFHVDGEANFLLQLYGTKLVYIFDGKDRELLSWPEIERYWHGDGNIHLKEGFEKRAMEFPLTPGIGVHNPVHFPHWVKNGPTPSIALSLAYGPKDSPVDVLHANHFLRKLGLNPTPPGTKQGLDKAKRGIIHGARSLRRVLKPS